jgi:hypothetical protein
MKHDMTPCIRYRAWLACSGRIPCPEHPANPYEAAYVRESIALYKAWVHQLWSTYNRKPMPEPGYSGFTHPDFDAWLQRIYLPQEVAS